MPNVVIDSGSGTVKSGLAGDDTPSCIIKTITGEPVNPGDCTIVVGEEVISNKDTCLAVKYPIEHGIVTCWDGLEVIWRHSFEELGVDPKESNVMLTGNFCPTRVNKERPVEIMFEKFDTPAVYIADQFQLALYSAGRTTGVVVEIGEEASYTVPVYEGYSLPHASLRFNLAGRSLTDFLVKLLEESGSDFSSPVGHDTANDIKETLCYVSQNYEEELATSEQNTELAKSYQLPDGKVIDIREPRLKCPEALFKPGLLGLDSVGIHEKLYSSIMECEEVTKDMFNNITLAGGSTMLQGLQERLQKEIASLAPPVFRPEVVAPAERSNSVWIGGSIFASTCRHCSQNFWITKAEYEEFGAGVIHTKYAGL